MRVKWSQRWSRAAARSSLLVMAAEHTRYAGIQPRRTGRAATARPVEPRLLHRRRDVLDLPLLEVLVERRHRLLDARRRLRREPADADAVAVDPVDRVGAALEVAARRVLDRVEHSSVDALQRRGEHVRAEVALVGVDPDPPHRLLLRRVERAETATARDLEHDHRAG